MSRRNFILGLSALVAASACSFKGGMELGGKDNKEENLTENFEKYEFDPFSGSKNSGFKFSSPLPFDFKLLDELAEINSKYKKSKLVTLYGSLPNNADGKSGFETFSRGVNDNVKNFNDFAKYVKYAKKLGFNFVYLVNCARPFTLAEYQARRPHFDKLVSNLKGIGVNNIKVANQQMLEFLQFEKGLNVQASTSFEYTNIRQFENLLSVYPFVKVFNLAIDTNRNILLLKHLKKVFPDVEFELMADESCIFGCPARLPHTTCQDFRFPCKQFFYYKDNMWKNICRTNVIYPWNLDYYANIGYKNFKLIGVPYGMRPQITSVQYVRDYFEAVENGVGGFKVNQFLKMIGTYPGEKDVEVSRELLSNLPDINFFIQKGNRCSVDCGAKCDYCFKCAEKLNKILTI